MSNPTPEVLALVEAQAKAIIWRFGNAAERWLEGINEWTRHAGEVRGDVLASTLMELVIPGLSEEFLNLDVDPMRIAQDVRNSRKGLAEPPTVMLADGIRARLATKLEEALAKEGITVSLIDL